MSAVASARSLALLRIAVAVAILLSPELGDAPALAATPRTLLHAPEGLGWFVAHVPITPAIARVAQIACFASALAVIAGLWTRPALLVMLVTGVYAFALSQLGGAVLHDMHLFWMTALLAASPCDHAWTLGRRHDGPLPSSAYASPLAFARLLLGVVYFFPGFHKLRVSGLAWAFSDNLRNQMWLKWAEHGHVPALRVDHLPPALLHLAALGVIVFEISFIVLAMTRFRIASACAGLLFHLASQLFLYIPFASLWLLYVVFLDRDKTRLNPKWSAGVVLLAAAAVQGARDQTQAWPFACYPTFEWIANDEMPDLRIEGETAGGTRVALEGGRRPGDPRSQAEWGFVWSVDDPRLEAYGKALLSMHRDLVRVRFYRTYARVDPDDRRVISESLLAVHEAL